jgi:hypothetical protein
VPAAHAPTAPLADLVESTTGRLAATVRATPTGAVGALAGDALGQTGTAVGELVRRLGS